MRLSSLLSLASVLLLASCGGGTESTGTGTNTNITPVVTTVTVSPNAPTLETGASLTLTAEARDQSGNVLSGKTVTWFSSNQSSVTVDASGVIKAISQGTSAVSATIDGKSGVAAVAVTQPAVASITLSVPPASISAGQAFTLVATLKDKNGATLTGRTVSWSTSAIRIAVVENTGQVTALSPGTATITALAEGISVTATVVVAAPAGTVAPSITSVSPATLTPGASATITGTNFGATIAGNSVFVAGVAATVTAATATQVQFTVPASIPCQSTQLSAVEVTTVGGTGSLKQTLAVATQRTLGVGQSVIITSGNLGCNELPTTGTYLVSVFNAGKTLGAAAGFELKGVAGGAASASRVGPAGVAPSFSVIPAPASVAVPIDPAIAAQERQHLQLLRNDMQLFRQLGSPSRYGRASTGAQLSRSVVAGATGQSQAAAVPVVGTNLPMNFHFNSCNVTSAAKVTARVVYVGPKVIVLEDNAGALAGKIDADLIALAKDFENVSIPLLANFGNPLAYDAALSGYGRVTMFFTPQVNNQGANLLGFVSGCDFYPPTAAASVSASNMTEIFYARAVTDTSPTSTSLNGRPQWQRQMGSTLIHETKHIIAYGERFQTPIEVNDFEETWLEEATAQLASELYGRAVHGNGWRTNSSYFGTLDCEVRPNTGPCGIGAFIMGNHFLFLADFLQNFESKTILSGTDDNDIYGSSWMFARWLTDTYGGTNEGAFMTRMVLNYNITGANNVADVTGKSFAELLGQFTLMLAADDNAAAPATFQEASWSLPGVYQGYNSDIRNPPPAAPLQMRNANFGTNFVLGVNSLKGGGAMILKLNPGSAGTQLLDLHNVGGAALGTSSTIGIAVLRVQ